jgi:hypothetical protein
VIVVYAAPTADGSGLVVYRCYRCRPRHHLDGPGTRRLRCGQVVQIRTTEDPRPHYAELTTTGPPDQAALTTE